MVPNLQVNDILYTKDGRKSGNLTVISVTTKQRNGKDSLFYEFISDYGTIIRGFLHPSFGKQFFKTIGKATPTHKYYNYKHNYPEKFI